MGEHQCHATGCAKAVPPRMFMCRVHWYRLPKPYQDAIWGAYVPGQETSKTPTRAYLAAARAAIRWMERAEAEQERKAVTDG